MGSFVTANIQYNTYAAGKPSIAHLIIKLKEHKNNPTQIPIIISEFTDELKDYLSTIIP